MSEYQRLRLTPLRGARQVGAATRAYREALAGGDEAAIREAHAALLAAHRAAGIPPHTNLWFGPRVPGGRVSSPETPQWP